MNTYDPVLAKAVEGLSMQEAEDKIAADPELHGFARMANFNFAGKAETVATLRKLMTDLGAPSYCDNPLCQRAGTCMTPKVRCFWENFDVMRRVVFPSMRRHLPELEAREEAERRAEAAARRR
jgi:hypothetical protein